MDRPTASEVCHQTIVIQTSPTAVAYEALTSKVSYLVAMYYIYNSDVYAYLWN